MATVILRNYTAEEQLNQLVAISRVTKIRPLMLNRSMVGDIFYVNFTREPSAEDLAEVDRVVLEYYPQLNVISGKKILGFYQRVYRHSRIHW